MLITFVLATHSPPPCHPFQVGTFLPPLHPQSLPLPPLYPPLLPTHCCPPLPPRCHPNRQTIKQELQCFSSQSGWALQHSRMVHSGLLLSSHLFITALLLFSFLRLLAVIKEPGLRIPCSLRGQRRAGGTCVSFSLTSLLFSIGAS